MDTDEAEGRREKAEGRRQKAEGRGAASDGMRGEPRERASGWSGVQRNPGRLALTVGESTPRADSLRSATG
jgi:hypothetical protein